MQKTLSIVIKLLLILSILYISWFTFSKWQYNKLYQESLHGLLKQNELSEKTVEYRNSAGSISYTQVALFSPTELSEVEKELKEHPDSGLSQYIGENGTANQFLHTVVCYRDIRSNERDAAIKKEARDAFCAKQGISTNTLRMDKVKLLVTDTKESALLQKKLNSLELTIGYPNSWQNKMFDISLISLILGLFLLSIKILHMKFNKSSNIIYDK